MKTLNMHDINKNQTRYLQEILINFEIHLCIKSTNKWSKIKLHSSIQLKLTLTHSAFTIIYITTITCVTTTISFLKNGGFLMMSCLSVSISSLRFLLNNSYLLHYLVDEDRTIQPPHTKEEIKDGQWLGVTVKSQGGTSGKVCILFFIVIWTWFC